MTTDITELAQREQLKEKFEAWLSEKTLYARYMHWCDSLNAYDYTGIQLAWDAYQAGGVELVEALEKAQTKAIEQGRTACELFDEVTALRQRIAELESSTVTVKPEDADGVREEGNQFLVVRHPGKVPVIKHPVGHLEDYLLQILKADPLATIDIVTHRFYGVGGQFVEDADEYLHEMGIKWEAE